MFFSFPVHPSRSDSQILWLYQVWPLYYRLPWEGLPSHRQCRQQWAQLPRQAAQRTDKGGKLQGHAHEVLASHVLCKWNCVCVWERERENEWIHLQTRLYLRSSEIIKLESLHIIRRLWAGRVEMQQLWLEAVSNQQGLLCFESRLFTNLLSPLHQKQMSLVLPSIRFYSCCSLKVLTSTPSIFISPITQTHSPHKDSAVSIHQLHTYSRILYLSW